MIAFIDLLDWFLYQEQSVCGMKNNCENVYVVEKLCCIARIKCNFVKYILLDIVKFTIKTNMIKDVRIKERKRDLIWWSFL